MNKNHLPRTLYGAGLIDWCRIRSISTLAAFKRRSPRSIRLTQPPEPGRSFGEAFGGTARLLTRELGGGHWLSSQTAQPPMSAYTQRPRPPVCPTWGREAGTAPFNSASQLKLFEAMEFFLDLALMRVL